MSLGLDVRVLKDDGTEVEMAENIDYGDTDLRSIIEGDRHYGNREDGLADQGYQYQEFKDGELVGVENEEDNVNLEEDDSYDDYTSDDNE